MDLRQKVVAGLGRLGEVYKVLLWEQAKEFGLSPIQIQILNFVASHPNDLNNVSYLAREFNVTKPTISDAVRVLVAKKLLIKDPSSQDNRSYSLLLSAKGQTIVDQTKRFAEPIGVHLEGVPENQLIPLFRTITDLIYKLHDSGVLSVQRTCFGCRYYEKREKGHYCKLLQSALGDEGIRLDCPEYLEKAS